eukprot:m.218831 g.218831  ORF g.218831 m.218831 type:complete len:198 (+) comp10158_c0_seq4:79-672(+)
MADLEYVQDTALLPRVCVCAVCRDPLVHPMAAPCRHVLCRACWARHLETSHFCPTCQESVTMARLVEGDHTLKLLLDDLIVYCPRRAAGCAWTGPRSTVEEHTKRTCELMPCPNGCSVRGTAQTIAIHVISECAHSSADNNEGSREHNASPAIMDHVKDSRDLHQVFLAPADVVALSVDGVPINVPRAALRHRCSSS